MNKQPSKILAINLNPAIDKVYAVDDFTIGGVFRPREMTATAGGKGLNVARVAHLLGEPIIATGFLGGGNGCFIEEQVRQVGITAEFVPIRGETRICIAVMDPKRNTSTEVLEPGPVITEEESQSFLENYRRLLDECVVVTASGSLPRGVPEDGYRKLIAMATERNIRFILDTSGEALKKGIEASPFLIKPNREEAEKLLGAPLATLEDQVEAVLMLKQKGVAIPVITLGKDGCVAGLPDGVYHLYGPAIQVVNTVGSGDSFVAGCAVGVARDLAPIEVIRLGMASAMSNTQFFQTGMVSPESVSRFFEVIRYRLIGPFSH